MNKQQPMKFIAATTLKQNSRMYETEMNEETMRLGLVAVTSRSLVTSRSTPWLHVAIGYLSAATHLGYFYMCCWGLYTCQKVY